MEVTYKRDAMYNYIVISKDVTTHSAFQEKMILKNQVDGLLSCSLRTFNGENQYYYDISGKQTLACLFEKRKFGADDLRQLFQGIGLVLQNMEKYLLEADYLLLKPEYIYYDLSSKQYFLCFFPFEQNCFTDKLGELAEYLLSHINHQENDAVVVGYQFYRCAKEKNISFTKILEELIPNITESKTNQSELKQNGRQSVQKNKSEALIQQQEEDKWKEEDNDRTETDNTADTNHYQKTFLCFGVVLGAIGLLYGGYSLWVWYHAGMVVRFIATKEFLIAGSLLLLGIVVLIFAFLFYRNKHDDQRNRQEILRGKEKNAIDIYEDSYSEDYEKENKEEVSENIAYEESEKTVLLSENLYKEEKILVSQEKRKSYEIPLTNFPFIIGSSGEFTDFVLPEKSVSRMHVKFIFDEEENTVFMQDLNSTNGTFHNGIRLENNELVPVYAGDEIQIGKRIFEYI